MTTRSRYLFYFMVFLFVVTTFVAAGLLLNLIVRTVLTTPIPFDIDESNHALDGWEVYHAVASADLRGFIKAVTDQAFYPPVYSLFIAAYYLAVGPGLFASRMPTVVNFALLILSLFGLTFYLLQRVFRHNIQDRFLRFTLALLGAGFSVALLVTSETIIQNSAICMLEITGALWVIPLMYLTERIDFLQGKMRWLALTLLALAVVFAFLTKYTFGLFWGFGVLLALLSSDWPWKASRRTWLESMVVAGIFLLSVVAWILLTRRESMFLFFTDHPSYVPFLTLENLLFYPRTWLTGYSLTPFIGVLVFILAVGEVIAGWKRFYVRFAAWSIFVALVILTISTTNEFRHILVVIPMLWILAGLRLAHIFKNLVTQPRPELNTSLGVGLLIIMFLDPALVSVNRIQPELVRSFEGKAYYSAMQINVLRTADLAKPVLMISDLDDQNSMLVYRWQAALETQRSIWDLNIDHFPYEYYDRMILRHNRRLPAPDLIDNFPRERLEEVLEMGYYETAIVTLSRKQENHILNIISLDVLSKFPVRTFRYPDYIIQVYDLK